ncbi:MAG: hypothetical protein DIZ77_12050 [endosymbiont of Seepiophila jonesi]|uniref:F0F1 ATP synthase subunit I n=1 Tax=endosymbiont of Lamellibrachia luymesi TaxID=2200907 RepID=A0A370DWD6_9GAMM|nr:MAG: hypothetical protein DIZ79_11970 [endosymbiont of Lamellibrachia luymesi]RDH90961.1 MAG: hypothetical protein DIZ77_12050 [endosymbiont of Seepiophila jonesi]
MQLAGNDQIRLIVLTQTLSSIAVAIILGAFGWVCVWSGLLGGLISTATNGFMAARIFVTYRAQEPGRMLAKMYGSELQKILLTGILFGVVVFWIKPLSIGAMLGSYLFVQVVAPLFVLIYTDQMKSRLKRR